MNYLIMELVELGIPVTIEKDDTYGVRYNLNTGMKSHLHIVEDDSKLLALMRYDETKYVYDLDDILWTAKSCMHGRDFLSPEWEAVLIEKNILSKHVKTEVSYS